MCFSSLSLVPVYQKKCISLPILDPPSDGNFLGGFWIFSFDLRSPSINLPNFSFLSHQELGKLLQTNIQKRFRSRFLTTGETFSGFMIFFRWFWWSVYKPAKFQMFVPYIHTHILRVCATLLLFLRTCQSFSSEIQTFRVLNMLPSSGKSNNSVLSRSTQGLGPAPSIVPNGVDACTGGREKHQFPKLWGFILEFSDE